MKTRLEKLHLRLLHKQKRKSGMDWSDVTLSDNALSFIISSYTKEAGVRDLERKCGSVFRRLALKKTLGEEFKEEMSEKEILEYLGPSKVIPEIMGKEPAVGRSTGLAYDPSGGSILFIQSVLVPGKRVELLTGNLGTTLKESASIADTWIKSNFERLGIDKSLIGKKTAHIHIPAGGTSKDGPSAGVAITISMLSAMLDVPVRNDVAMTGEIDLNGRVLAVGGITTKVMAAHRAGIREIILPKDNEQWVSEIPKEISEEIQFHYVSILDEAIKLCLVPKEPIVSIENFNEGAVAEAM
jgi:ATP-dependent Lon protease